MRKCNCVCNYEHCCSLHPDSHSDQRFSRKPKIHHCVDTAQPLEQSTVLGHTHQWRTEGGGGVQTPPPPEILKTLQNRAKLNPIVKTVKIAEFRMPTLQDVRKKGSKILKLPRFAIVLH